MSTPLVGVVMGSTSDRPTVQKTIDTLAELEIPAEVRVLSAHRTPRALLDWVETAEQRGIRVIIAAAGMSAALPGVVAAQTLLPVLGVPIASGPLGGVDALLAIAQMPGGIPVGTLAIGDAGATNAAVLATQILALSNPAIRVRLHAYRERKAAKVLEANKN